MNKENFKKELIPMPISKRLFDIMFSVVAIVITLPLTVLILIVIFIEHMFQGKIFTSLLYKEIRISQGQPFDLIKFNIFKPKVIEGMRSRGEFIYTKKLEHDGYSLTPVGKILQMTYLDELPQLFSILKGELSLIGPRPVNLEVYQKMLTKGVYSKTIMTCGLTGNFQAAKGMTKKTDIELDNEYIDYFLNNSSYKIFLFDMKIILRTLKVLFKAEGI
jgi:lipopolysaccharide/colanic/teichoic acid biosynthesis glycosyltransferase